MLVFALLHSAALATPPATWFYPDASDRRVEIAADGSILGRPARRTGALVAEVSGVEAVDVLSALPGVGQIEVLRGDGTILRIFPTVPDTEVALSRALHDRPDVRWAHPDFAFELVPHALPDDPFLGDQWHLANVGQSGGLTGADVNAEAAWAVTHGEGILISIVDSGVDPDHPDLNVVNGRDYIDRDDDSDPGGDAHGTAAAGLAGAVGNNGVGVAGVSWGAQIYGIRLIGGDTTLGDVYSAFSESADAGAHVINNSWGFSGCEDLPLYGVLDRALDYAAENGRGGLGTAVVFSAGNDACDDSTNEFLQHPAVIGVSAIDHDDLLEDYSNWGDTVDIAGQAGGMVTTDVGGEPGYGNHRGDQDYTGGFSGTSSAAPVVSGVMGLIFAANPQLTARQARDVLCDTAVRIQGAEGSYDAEGWSPYFGCGRPDAAAAVYAVANDTPGAPELLAPTEEAWVDRVILQWAAAEDPDGDPLAYEVRWWTEDPDDGSSVVVTGALHLDITGEVGVGDDVEWTVVAADAWGSGPAADAGTFSVSEAPLAPEDTGEPAGVAPPAGDDGGAGEDPGGCAAAGGWPAPALALVGLLGVARRQRSSGHAT